MLTCRGEKDNGCIINTAFQVANDPMRLVVSSQMGNLSREIIERTGVLNISVLDDTVPFETIRRFGMQTGRLTDKFDGFDGLRRSANGLYYVTEHTNAYFSLKVVDKVDLGSHMLFVTEVTEAVSLSDAPSCTYAHYHKAIKPR